MTAHRNGHEQSKAYLIPPAFFQAMRTLEWHKRPGRWWRRSSHAWAMCSEGIQGGSMWLQRVSVVATRVSGCNVCQWLQCVSVVAMCVGGCNACQWLQCVSVVAMCVGGCTRWLHCVSVVALGGCTACRWLQCVLVVAMCVGGCTRRLHCVSVCL